MKYFSSGSVEKHTSYPAVTLVITKFKTISEKIIPFFESYPPLHLPMPVCHRPALQLPMPVKWRESRANGGSSGQMLVGVKKNDYLDWCSVARLMSNKAHITQEGLNLIRTIKSSMNTGRK